MSERYPGWVDGMDAREARLATGGLAIPASDGEPGDALLAVQARSGLRPAPGTPGAVRPGDGLTVIVDPFQATIQDGSTAGGGAYLVTLDSPKEIQLTESDQNDDRTDLIVAELTEPGDDNTGGFVVRGLTGAYDAGGPPALPETAIALVEVAVPAGAQTIDQAGIVDRRIWTCAAGGVLLIANESARPTNPYPGLYVHDLAAGVLQMYDGSAWRQFVPEIDTGWIDLEVNEAGGWLPPDPAERQPPQVRRVGSTVFLRGFAIEGPNVTADDRTVVTVPENMRPSAVHHWAAIIEGPPVDQERDIVDLLVTSSGTVQHWDLVAQPNDYWFAMETSWLVDD